MEILWMENDDVYFYVFHLGYFYLCVSLRYCRNNKEIKIRVPITIGISKIQQHFMTLLILVASLKQANFFLLKRVKAFV